MDALAACDTVVVLWSRNYALSPNCIDELEQALDQEEVGVSRVWAFNLDGSDVTPPRARNRRLTEVQSHQVAGEVTRRIASVSASRSTDG